MSARERPETLVFVGCGAAKKTSTVPARELYTSNYFGLKREYAETVGDSWAVLSALYGMVEPDEPTIPYDVTIGDYPLDNEQRVEHATIGEWAGAVLADVEQRLHGRDGDRGAPGRVVILAGRSYVEPLRDELDRLAAECGAEMVYPFDDTSGIGEQMGWLSERIEAVESTSTTPTDTAEKGDE